ncbi:DUF357 domain-containing protein [Candidatus Woesearchaeota archaeon]|nr:DUF357 domain-containing protein [Candidatus Woesearchaeota archaeon]
MKEITEETLNKYFDVTKRALDKVNSNEIVDKKEAHDFLDMAQRYYKDANYFKEKGDYVRAFGALNYAHAWLDAGARLKWFKVNDSDLFAAD